MTIAVVSWNTRDLLARCLDSMQPAARAGLADVWVVDNGSSDGSRELLRERYGWVTLVEADDNPGFGAAVNLVGRRTRTPWLALSNADVVLRDGALERLVEAGECDARAGLVAPRLILPNGVTQHSVWAFPTVASTALIQSGAFRVSRALADRLCVPGWWRPERARRVPWAVGAFLLARRSAWEQIGGFDEHHWMSAEDLDLGWRLREAGWATRYEPRAVADHHHSSATSQVWGAELPLHWQRCAYAWMLRRWGRPRTVAVGLLTFAGSGARWLLLFALVRINRERWAPLRPGLGRWTLVHLMALAPRRVLARYR